MKKFSVILLIAVLAMTSVFAADPVDTTVAISGKATAKYVVDVENGFYNYTAPGVADLEMAFTITGGAKATTGEGLWAELAASVKFDATDATDPNAVAPVLALDTFKIHNGKTWAWDFTKATDLANLAKSDLTTVKNAKNKNITFDDAVTYGVVDADKNALGTTFTWNISDTKAFTFSAVVNGGLKKTHDMQYYIGASTPAFEMAKGFTIQGAGAIGYKHAAEKEVAATDAVYGWCYKDDATGKNVAVDLTDTSTTDTSRIISWDIITPAAEAKTVAETRLWTVGGSLAVAYASEDGNIAVKAATDQAITFGDPAPATAPARKDDKDVAYDIDAALDFTFKPATLNVYYAKNASATLATGSYAKIKNLLSAKAVMNLDMFNPAIKATFIGKNLLHKASVLSTELEVKLGTNYSITAYANDILGTKDHFAEAIANSTHGSAKFYKDNYEGQKVGVKSAMTFGKVVVKPEVWYQIALERLGFSAEATYTNANFVVNGGFSGAFFCDDSYSAKYNGLLQAKASIESTTFVKGATLKFAYASGNFMKRATEVYADETPIVTKNRPATVKPVAPGAGTATFSCEIAF